MTAITSFIWEGDRVNISAEDAHFLRAVASNQDVHLPFRAHRPSVKALLSLFSGHPSTAWTTSTGFKNAVITRFISFNSPFLLSGAQKYANSVQDLSVAFSASQHEEKYFVSAQTAQIQGHNVYRRTANAPVVWDSCVFPSIGRNFKTFWTALYEGIGIDHQYKLKYVGAPLALQIAGMLRNF